MTYYNNLHMFIVIVMLAIIISLLFSSQCLAHSKFDLPERLQNKLAYDELDARFGSYNPISLARGTPELLPPRFLNDALTNVSKNMDIATHQYMPPEGYAELRKEIALLYSSLINRPLNISENILVTMGVTQGIYLSILVHTAPGDEWIVLEPVFEIYISSIKVAGGTVVPVPLIRNSIKGKSNSRDFVFDKDELRNAFNSKTKGIIVNNPHNPTGKSFTNEELLFIGELAIKWNTLIISDEVYEWANYDSNKHIRIASLGDDIFNRTVTLSSISKTFFASGYRVGWAYGPSKLIENMKIQQHFIILSGNSYAQIAATEGLRKLRYELGRSNSYLDKVAHFLEQKRNFLLEILNEIGMEAIVPEAGFFIYANWTGLTHRITGLEQEIGDFKDWKFVSWLVKNTGVLIVPGTELYLKQNKKIGEDYVRLCFAKDTEILRKAATALKKLQN